MIGHLERGGIEWRWKLFALFFSPTNDRHFNKWLRCVRKSINGKL